MAQNKELSDAMKYLTLVSQVGLSIVVPIILCLLLGNFLQRQFGWGQWVLLVAILLGVGGAISNLISFLNMAYAAAKKREDAQKEE